MLKRVVMPLPVGLWPCRLQGLWPRRKMLQGLGVWGQVVQAARQGMQELDDTPHVGLEVCT